MTEPREHAERVREALDYFGLRIDYQMGRQDDLKVLRSGRESLAALETRLAELERALRRTVYIAEHLFQMVSQEAWRDSGGDDMQGHYEGDYHAENVRVELAKIRATLPSESETQ